MKKSVIIISLFLFGTVSFIKAQEMTQKEKTSYAIGTFLGEKIKEKARDSGIDMSIVETIKEKLKEKIDFESIKAGFLDDLKGELKLSKKEIATILSELEKAKENLENLFKANQSKESNSENINSTNYLSALANNYGTLSWNYLFIKEYKQAEQSALKALKLDNTQTWVKTNLAHALLFQNKFSKAEKIYKELSQTTIKGNETYTKAILKDFDELEKAGVISEKSKVNVEKIKKMLN